MYKVLDKYSANLRLTLFDNKFVSDRYDFSGLDSRESEKLAKEIVILNKKEKYKIKEYEQNLINTCQIDRIDGEIRFIRPYVLAQLLKLYNGIDCNKELPPDFFIKRRTLFMVNTLAFNVPEGSSANNNMSDFDRVLYGLNVFESTNLKELCLLHTRDFSFSEKCQEFIDNINRCNLKEFIKVKQIEVSEKFLDEAILDLIEKINPAWKRRANNTEFTKINLKDNLKRFSNYFKIYD